ncbi:MAG: DUF4242 domain-containing protein [Desulfobacterales bacterium]|nr:DUF4242 domain-containing protein [Desulfobacterales bacterium]
MAKMGKFMVVHHNPGIDCKVVQANWRKMANIESATWIRTYINEAEGMRYCVWMAPSADELKRIFKNMDVSWESILPVEETVPDLWGDKWEEHLQKEPVADTLGN